MLCMQRLISLPLILLHTPIELRLVVFSLSKTQNHCLRKTSRYLIQNSSWSRSNVGVVQIGNNQACKVYGVGTIRLKFFNDRKFLLRNLRHVPKLKRNLLSLSILEDLDYCNRVEYKGGYFT